MQTTTISQSSGWFRGYLKPDCSANITWLNTSTTKPSYLYTNSSNEKVYLVDPGTYVLNSVELKEGNWITRLNTRQNLAHFTIKGGEVLYIGNLVINARAILSLSLTSFFPEEILVSLPTHKKTYEEGRKNAFTVEDNFSTAKIYIHDEYSDIYDKLQKRLIETTH